MPDRDKLESIMDMQAAFQATVPDGVVSFKEYTDQDKMMEHIRTQTLACITELTEALAETGWKPWASSRHFNIGSFRSEITDAFRFLLNLIHISGMSADELMDFYITSLNKTRLRVEGGYDGLTSKCRGCHRDFSDAGVHCYPEKQDGDMVRGSYCSVYGWLSSEASENKL